MDIRFKNTELYVKSFAETKLIQYFIESYQKTRQRGSGVNSAVISSGKGGDSLNVKSENGGLDINLYGNSYLEGVDKGTEPFFPNVNEIKSWIKTKPVTLKDFKGNTLPMTESNIASVAYKIGEAISLRGIAPANYIGEVVEKAFEDILDGILPSLKEDVKEKLEDILISVGYTKQGDTYVLNTK